MTNFTIKVVDKSGQPVLGATVTATWSQFIAGQQKEQVITDAEGLAQFNIGVNDASVQFLATKGTGAGEGSAFVGILGDTNTPNITITLAGSALGLGATNFFANLANTIKADSTYLVIFGGIGAGVVVGAYAVHKIRNP